MIRAQRPSSPDEAQTEREKTSQREVKSVNWLSLLPIFLFLLFCLLRLPLVLRCNEYMLTYLGPQMPKKEKKKIITIKTRHQ